MLNDALIKIIKDVKPFYDEPHRYYHNWEHIQKCISMYSVVEKKLKRATSVYLALLFHDIVYDPKSNDNELRSANFAYQYILSCSFIMPQIKKMLAMDIYKLIMCTRTHEPVKGKLEHDSCYMIDIDLVVFGSDKKYFDKWDTNIRKEYSFIPEQIYNTKRAELIKTFIKKDYIFYTNEFRKVYEIKAKKSLKNLLKRLNTAI